MLAEAVLHATARSNASLRRAGLVGDAVALWSRATRRRRAWRPHEERCRAFVESVLDRLPGRGTVLVLGSGLLRDVPIERLAREFDRVVLVDAVHLLPARWRAGRLGCRMIVADLATGPAEGGARPLAAYAGDPSVGLVISANVLSQLAMAPGRRTDDPARLAREITAGHLADLGAFEAPVCLMTDVRFTDIRRAGAPAAPVTLVEPSLLPGRPDDEWEWEVAPRGEISRDFARIHRVQAWRDLNGPRARER